MILPTVRCVPGNGSNQESLTYTLYRGVPDLARKRKTTVVSEITDIQVIHLVRHSHKLTHREIAFVRATTTNLREL